MRFFLILLACLWTGLATVAEPPRVWRIMPVGDSIAEGGGGSRLCS